MIRQIACACISAAAAGESSPDLYAEFLATRALGRPLAVGLGITAGKSDLYRRVAMLVKNDRTLESRCPRHWTALVATVALALVALAATFGERSEMRVGHKIAMHAGNGEQFPQHFGMTLGWCRHPDDIG